jgi:outer membrane protein
MKRIWIFLGICLLGIVTCAAQDTSANYLTLKQCIDRAMANNADVQQKKLTAEASAVLLKQSKNNALPDLFADLNHGLNQGRSIDPFTNGYINQSVAYGNYGLSSAVVLFNGAQNKNTIVQNRLNYQADEMDAAQTQDNVTINVIVAYLQILNNQDLLKQAMDQFAVTRNQVERLATLDKAGAVAPATYYDLKGQLASDELAIINARNALDQAKLTLAQLMNVPYNPNLQVKSLTAADELSAYPALPAEIYAQAAATLPIVKAAELRQQSALQGLKIAKGSFYPIVSLGGSMNTYYSNAASMDVLVNSTEVESGDFIKINGSKVPVMTQRPNFTNQKISYGSQFNNNYNTSVYLNVRVPLFNGFRARNKVAAARIQMRSADVTAQTVKTQLNQSIEQAYFNLAAAGEKMKALQAQVKDFGESFRIAEVRFNAGAITQVDYLVAKNNLDKSNANLIIARYDYIFRSKILDYYQGKLSIQ